MDSTSTEQILNAISELRLEIRGGISGLQTEITGLHTEITGLRADVADLRIRIDRLEADVASVKADAHATRSAIMDRIDRLQNTIDQLRSEMTVNWAMADTAIKKARGNQDEVREVYDLVSSMQRQIRLLAARVDGLESRGSAPG